MSLSPFEIQRLADAIAQRLASRATGDVLINSRGAAEILACSVPTVERLTKSGAIPSVKVGRLRRYRRADLLALASEKGGPDHDE
jgi:excisionase family DNA binding protein